MASVSDQPQYKFVNLKCPPAPVFKGYGNIFLHCVLDHIVVKFSNFLLAGVKARIAHISLPGVDFIGRAVLLDTEEVYDDEGPFTAIVPKLIGIDESCVIEVRRCT